MKSPRAKARSPRRNARQKQKPRGEIPTGFLKNLAVPTFALVGTIIGLKSLTTVFGMGTGVSFSVCSPEEERRTVRHGALNLEAL